MRAEYTRMKDEVVQEAVAQVRSEWTSPGYEKVLLKEAMATSLFSAGQRRWWCSKCDTFKAQHTHHCSVCRRCVLEMDHHCVWVNNCVGWRNHKYFLLFVFYGLIASLWSLSLIVFVMMEYESADFSDPISGGAVQMNLFWRLAFFDFFLPRLGLHLSVGLQVWCLVVFITNSLFFVFGNVLFFGSVAVYHDGIRHHWAEKGSLGGPQR